MPFSPASIPSSTSWTSANPREHRRAIDEALDACTRIARSHARPDARLAAFDIPSEILEAYDAIRAAGRDVADQKFPAPPQADIAKAFAAVRSLLVGWKTGQLAHLIEVQAKGPIVLRRLWPKAPKRHFGPSDRSPAI